MNDDIESTDSQALIEEVIKGLIERIYLILKLRRD